MKFESVTIMFANPKVIMIDHYDRILEAIKESERNLSRWGIHVVKVGECINNRVTILLTMKDDVPFNNPGNRLRGIPRYLLAQYPEIYREMREGSRLLCYIPGKSKTMADPKRVCLLVELSEDDDSREAIGKVRADVRSLLREHGYKVVKIASWSKEGRISDLTGKEKENE